MKPLKAILIDDDPVSRQLLKNMIHEHLKSLEVIAEADTALKAIEVIRKEDPDLIFLDINMPGDNGFYVVNKIQQFERVPEIIFVTAYDEFAIDAFKCAAFDYLLKPVKELDLIKCYNRLLLSKRNHKLHPSIEILNQQLIQNKLQFNTREGCLFIDPKTILYLQADGHYTDIFLQSEKSKTVTLNIGKIEEKLNSQSFYRISRSVIINKRYLAEINRKDRICILMHNEKEYKLKFHPSFIKNLLFDQ
ncbi:MAG: LytTR family DNA-binding domain-containing protein [Bacteroidetes bacterium]|nr:LytTR family DNA-binding domain-containing protein [Bacteroidota bacterium]